MDFNPYYEEKINQLAKDWEEFIGKDVYKQEKYMPAASIYLKIWSIIQLSITFLIMKYALFAATGREMHR